MSSYFLWILYCPDVIARTTAMTSRLYSHLANKKKARLGQEQYSKDRGSKRREEPNFCMVKFFSMMRIYFMSNGKKTGKEGKKD